MQGIPPFYHPDLDESSSADPALLRPVPEPWQTQQPTLVAWFTELLKYRYHKTRCSTQGDVKEGDSDWEREHKEALDDGWVSVDPLEMTPGARWNVRTMMPDRLYLELTKVLLNSSPLQYLASLQATKPQLHKVIQRQLDEHGRYHLFWAYTNLFSPDRPDVVYVRLVPALYRVESSCQSQHVNVVRLLVSPPSVCSTSFPQVRWVSSMAQSGTETSSHTSLHGCDEWAASLTVTAAQLRPTSYSMARWLQSGRRTSYVQLY
jgi:hypothetical protein